MVKSGAMILDIYFSPIINIHRKPTGPKSSYVPASTGTLAMIQVLLEAQCLSMTLPGVKGH